MKKTVGIFAHVDAGKTTFAEQILYHTNTIKQPGKVDRQNAFFDSHSIEKRRGISVFSEQAYVTYNENEYYLIDTPGHVDFSAEMERTIKVIDYAIIIVSGIDGVQSHTETVYELLEAADVPVFFFVNKMDIEHADYDTALKSIQKIASTAVDFTHSDKYECMAECDEKLLELFFEENLEETFYRRVVEVIQNRNIMPVFHGSALKDTHIKEFLVDFDKLTTTQYTGEGLKAYVYKVKHDCHGVRESHIKLMGGNVNVRDQLNGKTITEIRRYCGKDYDTLSSVSAGDTVALMGVDSLSVGDTINMEESMTYQMTPNLQSKVSFEASVHPKEVFKALKTLEVEDPSLNVTLEKNSGDIKIGIMGKVQLEILKEIIQKRFSIEVSFEPPTIIYKETIRNSVIGYGHFEPLKHYAEVHLKLEPNPGGGILFKNESSTDDLTYGHQNLIKHHIFEKKHRGILTGAHITDLKITLLTGRAHAKHTSGGDFRQATIRALRQGLEQAENVLLEPMYQVRMTMPTEQMGKVLTDVQKMNGKEIRPLQKGESVTLIAKVPVASFIDYPTQFASITSGRGRLRMKMIGYDICHNQEEVIKNIGYDKVLDREYPSASIFCSKGKGYTVSWQNVKEHMHCID